jgi:hypothetical protein
VQTFRGIVINPGFKSLGGAAFTVDVSDTPDLLRQCLLYWDRIEWPTNNLIHVGGGPEIDYLVSAGALNRSRVTFQGMFSGDVTPVFAQGQLAVFNQLEAAQPGCWSIGQGGSILQFPGQGVAVRRALEVELYEALPAPSAGVSFEDVLEFRQHYSGELQSLRTTLDELYADILASSDPDRARILAKTKLRAGIEDVEGAMNGRRLAHWRASCTIELSSREAVLGALAGAGASSAIGIPIGLAALGGAVVGGLLNLRVARVPTPTSARTGAFAYLYHAKRELG